MIDAYYMSLSRTAPGSFYQHQYESFSDVGESRVWFASKNLTPCRMHRNAFLIAQIIAKCHSFPNMCDMLKAKVDRLAVQNLFSPKKTPKNSHF